MSLVRAVAFEGVDAERMAELAQQVETGERPEDVPITELLVLHDEASGRALVLQFFANDADYERGAAVFSAMPATDTPGQRTSVDRYTVVARATA
jgi:hypothetical protein